MVKEYDPILCMMVDKPTRKVQDLNKYVEQAIKWLKSGKSNTEVLFGLQRMGLPISYANEYFADAMRETGYKYSSRDSNTDTTKSIDAAVKVMDFEI